MKQRAGAGARAHPAFRVLVMSFFVVFGMAPTVGDIGSCGQSVDDLSSSTFFVIKASYDCDKCRECGLSGSLCDQACAGVTSTAFATGCRPLVHDGEVCLNALLYASCDDYASYVDAKNPKAPSECQFCPLR